MVKMTTEEKIFFGLCMNVSSRQLPQRSSPEEIMDFAQNLFDLGKKREWV